MKNFITLLVGVCLLVGCSADKSTQAPASEVTILPIITRVEGMYFETGDQIGLSIVRASGTYVDNVKMSYDGSIFAADGLRWYDALDAATLAAYYPYMEAGVPVTFSVQADQTAGCESSDLLVAVKQGVTPSTSSVGMVFRHLMAAVSIHVTNRTGHSISAVSIGGTVLSAAVDIFAQQATPTAGAAARSVSAAVETPGVQYRAVLVPQTTTTLSVTVNTSDGKSRSATFAATTLAAGKIYTMGLLLENETLTPSISGEVTDWVPGGALEPNPDIGGGDDEDGQNSMTCQGVDYRTVTLANRVWMAENLRHVPADVTGRNDVRYPNGMQAVDISVYGMLYDAAAAASFCPAGWRIPTEEDFTALIAALSPPYDKFIPMAGMYVAKNGEYKNYGNQGCLAGSTAGTASNSYKCCTLLSGQVPQILSGYDAANCVSVRYVKSL